MLLLLETAISREIQAWERWNDDNRMARDYRGAVAKLDLHSSYHVMYYPWRAWEDAFEYEPLREIGQLTVSTNTAARHRGPNKHNEGNVGRPKARRTK